MKQKGRVCSGKPAPGDEFEAEITISEEEVKLRFGSKGSVARRFFWLLSGTASIAAVYYFFF